MKGFLEINQDLTFEINHTYTLLSTIIHHTDLQIFINTSKAKIYKKEKSNDKRRDRKLDLLLKNVINEDHAKVSIINFTRNKIKIPEKIEVILELGLRNPIGGVGDKTQILHKNENLFSNWLSFAQIY